METQFLTEVLPICADENDIDQAQFLAFAKGEIAPNRNIKCFAKCAFIKFGLMDDGGNWFIDNDVINKIKQENANDAEEYLNCVKNNQGDDCDKAYQVFECIDVKF